MALRAAAQAQRLQQTSPPGLPEPSRHVCTSTRRPPELTGHPSADLEDASHLSLAPAKSRESPGWCPKCLPPQSKTYMRQIHLA